MKHSFRRFLCLTAVLALILAACTAAPTGGASSKTGDASAQESAAASSGASSAASPADSGRAATSSRAVSATGTEEYIFSDEPSQAVSSAFVMPDDTRIINGRTYTLTFKDDFDGDKLDASKWSLSPEEYRQDLEPRGRWDNDMVSVRNGCLVLSAAVEDGTPVSGSIHSHSKFSQCKGYFECRCRVQKAPGFWSAFWLMDPMMSMPWTLGGGAEDGAEIDIFESFSVRQGGINHAVHWNGYGANHKSVGKGIYRRDLYQGFHTYALEWTDDAYIWYVDGRETWRTSEPGICRNKLFIILSNEFGTWADPYDPGQLPDEVLFDYVRVWQAG